MKLSFESSVQKSSHSMDPVPMFLLESLGLSLVYAVVITYFFNANPLQGAAPEDTVFSKDAHCC